MGFGTFLMAVAGPLARKVLVSLGFGLVTYAAVSAALAAALDAAKAAWAGLAGEALALIQIAGINTAASILAGALVARVALQMTKRIGLVK
ncbi:DUF2523 family protein [Variovorax sp.]|uniref:DUF2523 family protein n=1 Tax=Variovorax sp. TaxID=1871043 RepID=UPI002D4A42C1|nr:DUF2523 family protein [Variovorax sp.]HYP84398.1 DUF2523 family protein [Variovorax sp.]